MQLLRPAERVYVVELHPLAVVLLEVEHRIAENPQIVEVRVDQGGDRGSASLSSLKASATT
jgi:hypothetical protein